MHFLLVGLSLGLSAGLSPGPLMTLVITTTLRDGLWHGLRVAAAPLVSDLPIVLLALFALRLLPSWTLAVLGVAGGAYVSWLGWETLRSARAMAGLTAEAVSVNATGRQTLLRGALVNLLNPHPYIFWATVGGPTVTAAYRSSATHAVWFLLGFYAMLIGSKAGMAGLVHSQAHLLTGPWYGRILMALAILLIGLGIWLGWQALQLAFAR